MSKNKENLMFGKKKSKLSVLPVIFSSILAAGAITGTAVSVWHVSKNYQESSEFTKSFNARINVNPVAYEKAKTDKTLALNNLKESASRLSAWLKYNGAQSYDVSYELNDVDTSKEDFSKAGWLSANFAVAKVDPIHKTEDKPEKIFNDPYLSYYKDGGFNTNNRTLVYRWYDTTTTETSNGPYYTLLDFNDVFEMPTNLKAKDNNTKALVDKDGKNGVLLKIKDQSVLKQIYWDMKDAADHDKDGNPKLKDFQKPRLYVINNIEQMFNEINYHLMCYATDNKDELKTLLGIEYANLYDNKEYQTFAKTIYTKDKYNKDRTTGINKLGEGLVIANKEGKTSPTKMANAEALNYLDLTKVGSAESSFLSKYVEKTFLYSDKNYQQFFPDKITDTYHNDEASTKTSEAELKLSYAWYPTTTSTQAEKYLEKQVTYGLKCKVVNVSVTETKAIDCLKTFVKSNASREVPPKFIDTIFGSNNVIKVLSIGFLIYLIILGIFLALLYRTTGVMSWICMMFMLSMSGLIAILGSGTISMSLLFGLFGLSIVGLIAALAICGRIKRRICSNEDTSVAVIKGLKKSLWPVVDISFIALLFGICFTYIAPITLNSLGVVLITGGFMTFINMYLLNGLLMLLFFNNGLTMNKFMFLGRPNNKANEALAQSNSFVPSSLDATKLEFAFFDRFSSTKFGLINLKTIIFLSAFGLILIIGIIVFSVQGLAQASLFHSSMCVVINSDQDVLSKLQGVLKYSSYQHYGNWWYFYCDALNAETMSAIKAIFADAQFGNIIGNTNKDILNYALLSMLITVLCASVYTGLRSNWTSFVPMLAGSLLIPLLMLGVGSIVQIKFDENVVLGFAIAVVFNTLISNTFLASINEAWFRKESYNNEEIKFIVTTSAKNNLSYLIYAAIGYLLFVLFFSICGPKGTGNLTWMMLIGGLVSMIVTPILVTYLLYWFLIIRAKALTRRAIKKASKVYVNMDDIDEQAIEGINKFTKVKAYSKKPEQPQGAAK